MSRQLSAQEGESTRARMREAWQWPGGYWYPLIGSLSGTLALDAQRLETLVPDDQIRSMLAGFHSGRCIRIRELDPDEETTIEDLESVYGWSEQFLVPENLEWVVYWSHEGTITFAGESLVRAVKDFIPNWGLALWP